MNARMHAGKPSREDLEEDPRYASARTAADLASAHCRGGSGRIDSEEMLPGELQGQVGSRKILCMFLPYKNTIIPHAYPDSSMLPGGPAKPGTHNPSRLLSKELCLGGCLAKK
eukprot:scaffold26311_cov19-Tisochrysis_lutea.AAC.2